MLSISQMGYGDWIQVLVPVLPLGDLWSTLRTHTHIYLTNILTVCAYVCGTLVYEDVIIPVACICEEEEIASLHWLFSALFHMESLTESGACQFLARLVARKPHNWCWDYRATLPQQGLSMVAGKLDSHPVLVQPSCSYPETGFQQPSITNARYREMTLGDQMYHSQSRQWLWLQRKRQSWGDPLRTWEGLLNDPTLLSFRVRSNQWPMIDRQWENPFAFEEWGLYTPSSSCEKPIFTWKEGSPGKMESPSP